MKKETVLEVLKTSPSVKSIRIYFLQLSSRLYVCELNGVKLDHFGFNNHTLDSEEKAFLVETGVNHQELTEVLGKIKNNLTKEMSNRKRKSFFLSQNGDFALEYLD